jgi:aconitate hydratase
MSATGHDRVNTRSTLNVGRKSYIYYSLAKPAGQLGQEAQ